MFFGIVIPYIFAHFLGKCFFFVFSLVMARNGWTRSYKFPKEWYIHGPQAEEKDLHPQA